MQSETILDPGLRTRRAGVPGMTRLGSAMLCVMWLATSFAQAGETKYPLIDHNQFLTPFPASYPKDTLAKLASKSAPPRPATRKAAVVAAKSVPVVEVVRKPTTLELVTSTKPDSETLPRVERVARKSESSPLVDAMFGSSEQSNSARKVRLGYGKMVTDNSRTVGTKNGTLLEEPGCLYVKTSLTF